MINSSEWRDQLEVAKQGYGLDRLVNDKDEDVRDTARLYHYKE